MTAQLLDLAGCRCAVIASNAVADRMRTYLAPFVIARTVRQPDVTVTIGCDSHAIDVARRLFTARQPISCRTAHPGNRYLVWTVDDHEILLPEWTYDHMIDTVPGSIAVTGDDCDIAAKIGTRVIRQLLMRGIENRCDGVDVHAGSVLAGDAGVLIGGKPGSGKTTMLTTLLERHAAPIAGDRTMVTPNGQSWQATAVPLAWRFTPQGLAGSRPLAQALPRMTPARGPALVDGKVELTPEEVGQVFGRAPAPSAAIGHIVVVARTAEPAPALIDGWHLRRHLDFGREDALATDWLNLFPHNDEQSRANESHWWAALASSVPVLALTWTDPAQLPELADTIWTWINS